MLKNEQLHGTLKSIFTLLFYILIQKAQPLLSWTFRVFLEPSGFWL